ncbi:kinetochore protein Spc25 [Thecamonas trahens ATCC 50062]|uniref:Kinetochore protein SPC25 n=1 Tax=Thecamonas trahens ATCC 50062 TaxID=461836 RepID=A0A0L0D5D7_THETB|nr:kinetochore protein Spc25 [Thecamonas trahens ATCC 50062]KNC47296.1 kinetochore protein Spc25 [Thecamonas trahens ATCC 50062]|eukprot:XP_013759637.1 kinetochore protein Spc25 [Thecamonas trahens ATCC 50062]
MWTVKHESFQEDLMAARRMLEKYERGQMRSAAQLQTSLASAIDDHTHSVAQLAEVRKQVDSKAQSSVAKKASLQNELSERKAAAEQAAAAVAALDAKENQYQASLATEKENVAQISMALAEAEVSHCSRASELEKGIAFYRSRLGMRFESLSDQSLRFIFTSIDPLNYDREFFFALKVNSASQYVLCECVPPVPGTDALLAKLNSSNNLRAFFKGMRILFRGSI